MPQNIMVWSLYWSMIEPHCIRVESYPDGQSTVIRQRLDLPALETLAHTYQIRNWRRFLEKVNIIFTIAT